MYLHTEKTLLYLTLRSSTDGNCLYSAISFQICGNNSLVKGLRFLTCWELYHNASYYANHTIINRIFETNTIFKTKSEIFSIFIYNATFETFDKNHLEMSVTQESKNSLVYGTWSPFLCVLALASVIQCNIESSIWIVERKSIS